MKNNTPKNCKGCFREKTCELFRNPVLRQEIETEGCGYYDDHAPTNGDKLRTMSNEEIADILQCECPPGTYCQHSVNLTCKDCWKNWLEKVTKGMKRQTIKFIGDYPKLHGQTSAELIAVRDIRIDRNTPKELLAYDTTKSDGSRYELKSGNYLQLIFVGNLGIPFCTIRSAWSDGKRDYYVLSIGEIFNIEVK